MTNPAKLIAHTMAASDFNNFPWIAPWQAISERGKEAYEFELALETPPGHPLYEVSARAVARTCHTDDVLFELEHHAAKLAVVHLTYIGRQEHSPRWPSVVLYRDWDHWIMRGMLADAARFESESDQAA